MQSLSKRVAAVTNPVMLSSSEVVVPATVHIEDENIKDFCERSLRLPSTELATVISGAFVVLTLLLSTYLLTDHLSSYKNPEIFVIGVILMVPCYSLESILRDCYESFAMYCFGRYLVACLGGEKRTIEFMNLQGRLSSKAPLLDHGSETGYIKHKFPMNYVLRPWKLGEWFYKVVKLGIVQYMIIKSFTALLAVVLQRFNVYCEGEFYLQCGFPYMAVVLNLSQSWALYCLVHFYMMNF